MLEVSRALAGEGGKSLRIPSEFSPPAAAGFPVTKYCVFLMERKRREKGVKNRLRAIGKNLTSALEETFLWPKQVCAGSPDLGTVGPMAQMTSLQRALGNPEREFSLSQAGEGRTPYPTPVGDYVLWQWGVGDEVAGVTGNYLFSFSSKVRCPSPKFPSS